MHRSTPNFEAAFAFRVMTIAVISSASLFLFFLGTGVFAPLIGVGLGFLGSVLGLVLLSNGQESAATTTFLGTCAIGVGWAAASDPSSPEAVGSAAISWLLLGVFGSLILNRQRFIVLGLGCGVATILLTLWVMAHRPAHIGADGTAVHWVFLTAGFIALDRIAASFRSTVEASRQAEHRARDAAEAKTRFLANMSHELRTPLNAILGYSEMLIDEAECEEDAADVQRIRDAGGLLLTHINALLDLSKIDAGRMELHCERVDLSEHIHEVVALCEHQASKRGNRFEIRIDAGLVLHTDRRKLGQTLTNLITNSVKFTQSGTIAITAKQQGDSTMISVSDSGIGIAPTLIPKLFTAFTQADSSTTRPYGGTGLGLALVKEFVELLEGTIEVESSVGEGSTFSVRIPTHHSMS